MTRNEINVLTAELLHGVKVPHVTSPFHMMSKREIYDSIPNRFYNKTFGYYPTQLNMFTIHKNREYIKKLRKNYDIIKLDYIRHIEPELYYLQCK